MENSLYDKIDDYLAGKLVGNNLSSFIHGMETDQKLAAEVASRKEAIDYLEAMNDFKVQESVREVHRDEMLRRQQRPKQRRLWLWAAAASFVGLLGVSFWLLNQPLQPDDLFAKYYETPNINFSERSGGNNPILIKANDNYDKKEFDLAIPLFEAVLKTDEENSKIRYALAISYLETGDIDRALGAFNWLTGRNDPLFGLQAKWYTGLVYLKKNEKEKAINSFKEFMNENKKWNKERAAEILNELN